jgi:hypothetical protein
MNLTECEIRSVLLGLMVEWKSGTLQVFKIRFGDQISRCTEIRDFERKGIKRIRVTRRRNYTDFVLHQALSLGVNQWCIN